MLEPLTKRDIERTIAQIKRIGGRKVRFIALYGSTAVGRYTNLSDIDLSVFYDGNKNERFRFRLKVLGRVKDDFDIQIFQDLPIYIRKEIISYGKIIYYREHSGVFNVFIRTIQEFEDFKPCLEAYYSNLEASD